MNDKERNKTITNCHRCYIRNKQSAETENKREPAFDRAAGKVRWEGASPGKNGKLATGYEL